MKRYFLITALAMLTFFAQAQFAEDALRFSQVYWQGTARSMATGSAFGGLGADFLNASTNPGGMGVYRSYAFSVTPEIFVRSTSSVYNGTPTDANRSMFDLSNLGYVMTKKIGRGGRGWKYYQISLGMNRLNNFNGSRLMQGMNDDNSRIDVYIEETWDMLDNYVGFDEIYDYDPFYLGPAWDTYLLDTLTFEGDFYITSPVPAGGILQTQSIETKGSTNEWLASFSANFDDIIYVGFTLGLPYIRYFRQSVYTETDPNDVDPGFNRWSVEENLRTNGWGVNAKLGILIRPVDFIRVGLAYHTPTYYWNMRDYWNTVTYADVYTVSTGEWFAGSYQSPDGEYRYKMTTPMRAIGSLSFVISDFGFITGEYEYVNYGSSKFKSSGNVLDSENDIINNSFIATHNFRLGTEWRIGKISLRGGYALYPSPYADNLNDGARQNITAGIGVQFNSLKLDFAYVHSTSDEDYYMYDYANYNYDPPITVQTNAVENTIRNQHFAVSLRYFFD
ncbi:MAG: hypothetical protein P8100_10635 [bacterium]|jgi:hypothetical protein